MTEHPMFNFIPLAGARREVADMNWQTQVGGQGLHGHLPQARAATVAPAAIGRDQQFTCLSMRLIAHLVPPAPNRFGGKPSRIMIRPDTDPALILGQIIDAIRDRFAQVLVDKVMHQDFERFTTGLPFAARSPEFADQFFLFRVHRNGRLAALLKRLHLTVEMLKLRVPVGMVRPLAGFAVALQTVARGVQQPPHRACTDRVPLRRQGPRQFSRTLAQPTQGRLRITARQRINQLLQRRRQLGVTFRQAFTPTAHLPDAVRGFNTRCLLGQFRQTFPNRIDRHARRRLYRAQATPPVGACFGGGPLSARPFV